MLGCGVATENVLGRLKRQNGWDLLGDCAAPVVVDLGERGNVAALAAERLAHNARDDRRHNLAGNVRVFGFWVLMPIPAKGPNLVCERFYVEMRGGNEGGNQPQCDRQPRRALYVFHDLVADKLHKQGVSVCLTAGHTPSARAHSTTCTRYGSRG